MNNANLNKTVSYIIGFLLGNEVKLKAIDYIGYTSNYSKNSKFRVIIEPSGFFDDDIYGSSRSIPKDHFDTIEDIPIIFGSSKVELQDNGVVVVKADIIASAYFFLSRYEEWLCPDIVDEHGRFPAKKSLIYKIGFINRPIVDMYGVLLRRWLRLSGIDIDEPEQKYSHIYLTHDVDRPFYCRTLRAMSGITFRAIKNRKFKDIILAFSSYFGKLSKDSHYKFPKMFLYDKTLSLENNVTKIAFFKAPTKDFSKEDRPIYNLKSKDLKALRNLCDINNVEIGLHASYLSGERYYLISSEADNLRRFFVPKFSSCRSHFLRCVRPDKMQVLVDSGIQNDFTLGFADVAGFRLGTCRAVKWINPDTCTVNMKLNLHPLIIMDCTLFASRYMSLNNNSAMSYCCSLFSQVKHYGGEVVLLWHNQSFTDTEEGHQDSFYIKILKELCK